jgi:hypothetical protein
VSGPGAGDGQVLETVLVGPPVAGLRGAASAVAYYASTPAARPRPARIDRALWGAGVALHAARLVWADRALFRAALVPTALTLAGCVILAGLATAGADEAPGRSVSTFNAFLVAFVALASMPPTVLQRLWVRMANQARRSLGQPPGEDPYPGESFARLLWREGWKALRQALVVSIGLAPLLGVARLLPLGHLDAALLAGGWALYWVVVDAFEIPMEVIPGPRPSAAAPWYGRLLVRFGEVSRWLRPSRWFGRALSRLTAPWNLEVRFTERHAWEVAGFGVVVGTLLAVPVLGLFFRAVAITGATALLGRLEPPLDLPPPPEVPPPLDAP